MTGLPKESKTMSPGWWYEALVGSLRDRAQYRCKAIGAGGHSLLFSYFPASCVVSGFSMSYACLTMYCPYMAGQWGRLTMICGLYSCGLAHYTRCFVKVTKKSWLVGISSASVKIKCPTYTFSSILEHTLFMSSTFLSQMANDSCSRVISKLWSVSIYWKVNKNTKIWHLVVGERFTTAIQVL